MTTQTITVRMAPELITRLDEARGDRMPRVEFIRRAVEAVLPPRVTSTELLEAAR